MIPTLAIHVPVSADSDYVQRMVNELQACRDRDTPSMEPVEGVASYIMGEFASLAYSGYHGKLMRLDFKFYHSLSERLQNAEITTSGTPCGVITLVII
jgi:hypothetical protein